MNTENTKKNKFKLKDIIYRNTFMLVISFVAAVVLWFSLAMNNTEERPITITDVPITFEMSQDAQNEGIKIFYKSYETADVSISGLNVGNITANDLSIKATLNPNSTKLAGNTLEKAELTLEYGKKEGKKYTDFTINSVSPATITVYYDRVKIASYDIEDTITYNTAANCYVSKPMLSNTDVIIEGPESSINKIGRVCVDYDVAGTLTDTYRFQSAITVYDLYNKPMNLEEYYLTLSVEKVDVVINVMNKQTVNLDVTKLNMPAGFSDERVTISPATIDIAGPLETISAYNTIILPDAIDFSDITLDNNSFTMEIPMPAGVSNVSNITEAKVYVNLNGFTETTLNLSAANFKFVNIPEDKDVKAITQNLSVKITGSQAQIAKLNSSSVYGIIDMANFAETNGNKNVNIEVDISAGTTSTCWVNGSYEIQVNVADKPEETSSVSEAAVSED
ncbi:MAG: hypothetical protein E7564_09215 [Ruminococcaceae bacterium]|nr:hypothetical protein [Oscillospiraceae bacterium]